MRRHPDVLAGWIALLLLGSWSTVLPDVLQAQKPAPETALFRDTWRTHDGLPHNAVTARHQTHDGYLWVGTAGFGSTFSVTLPLTLEATAALPVNEAMLDSSDERLDLETEMEEDAEMETSEAGENAPLVLLVEDNPDVRGFLRQTLGRRYRIAEAASGDAGLAQAHAEIPDLVISDVMMPEMDGLELCRRLRAESRLSAVPVILLTARASEESKLEGLGAGADDYLTKPFGAAELHARAENLIEIRRHLRQRFSAEVVVQPTQVTVPAADAVFLERVKAVVENYLDDGTFGVERLADEAHLSRRQLHRKLRDLTGLSSVGFIRVMRLERAAQLLEQRAGTIAEIAYRVGFQERGILPAFSGRLTARRPPSTSPSTPRQIGHKPGQIGRRAFLPESRPFVAALSC